MPAVTVRPGKFVSFVLLSSAALVLALGCNSDDRAPVLTDPSLTAAGLVDTYMAFLENRDIEGLEVFLSDAFLRQGAEGSFLTKTEYLANLPQISNFTISDVTATQDEDTLAVQWLFMVEEQIGGSALSREPTPRLATFVWRNGEWKLLTHSNFNPPAAP